MLGVSDDEIDGAAGTRVAKVVQGAGANAVASGAVAAARATAGRIVAATAFEAWLGKILDAK